MARTEVAGRERELALLGECLDAALTGEPRIVVCCGEPGIGKTRLAEEVAARALTEGVPAVWAAASSSTGRLRTCRGGSSCGPSAEVVDIGALAEEHGLAAEVSRLAPEAFPSTAPAAGNGSPEDRFRKLDAVGRLLRERR